MGPFFRHPEIHSFISGPWFSQCLGYGWIISDWLSLITRSKANHTVTVTVSLYPPSRERRFTLRTFQKAWATLYSYTFLLDPFLCSVLIWIPRVTEMMIGEETGSNRNVLQDRFNLILDM